jgi:hypothetical protein
MSARICEIQAPWNERPIGESILVLSGG